MRSGDVRARIRDVRDFFAEADGWVTSDPDSSYHWGRYATIVIAGALEQSIKRIVANYVTAYARREVVAYVVDDLRLFRNPDLGDIYALLGAFGGSWKDDVKLRMTKDHIDAITHVMANRNKVAHGAAASPRYADLSRHFEFIVEVLEIIESEAAKGATRTALKSFIP